MRIITIVILFITNSAFAQNSMKNWRVHFSTTSSIGIANSSNAVYMATINGIIKYDNEDNSISTLSVTNGLSDLNISAISDNNDLVIIGYVNGNIDVLKENTIINVPWIKRAQISGSKSINDFHFSDNRIFISSNIGIVVYDIDKNEIEDTYYPYLNPVINDFTLFKDSLYAATTNGIYTAHKNQTYLNDVNSWSKKENLPLHIKNGNISSIETFNNNLFFILDSQVFQEDSLYYISTTNEVTNYYENDPVSLINLKTEGNEFLIVRYSSLEILDENLAQKTLIYDYSFGTSPKLKDAIKFDNQYWISDKNNGLVKGISTWNNTQVFSNSPYTDGCYRLDIQYGKVLVAGGGLTHNLQNNFFRNGAYSFENETWTNFNSKTQTEISDSLWDVICVSINPNNTEQMAFGSYSKGGLKIINSNNTVEETYSYLNSPLETQTGNGTTHIISDLKYDNDGNLWVLNDGINPLKMLSAEGIWYSFNLGSAAKNKYPYRLLIDSKGNKWVALEGIGIVVFNENGTFDDPTDDNLVSLTTAAGYGSLPSASVKSIAEDIDGEIWIGTETGLVVIYSTENIYNGEYGDVDANEINLKYGEEIETLLGTSSITAIAVDGGNRKWIGTSSSGVFCFSANGTDEVYRFNTDNSPLLSNSILDIKIDHVSGEVYFATESGLISFRADATIGDEEFSEITVFPNPVRPEFGGPITIQGLGYESDVKITDVSGNLIYQTTSNGGTVIWDGKRLTGERVQSGVYLVWSGSTIGKGKAVAKILFIN